MLEGCILGREIKKGLNKIADSKGIRESAKRGPGQEDGLSLSQVSQGCLNSCSSSPWRRGPCTTSAYGPQGEGTEKDLSLLSLTF